ncbi:MDR family MFS transporter [Tessaracoccus antarcticus]|uniref:MFS transporter n=1 Tax=Tessaracoccus antarcticus TaxID=2479848 RepID=A0A3M0GJM8_9ACTN|nr:MDR family MFS transporter [Tessaracoccus antarcticus]RMB61329.1 MFS transporter [Tessaracoccus antarcticus]
MTKTPTAPTTAYKLSPQDRQVFIGLMIGMLVASVSQTIVGPAMPRIVADLGGIDHYSWVATAAMLTSAVSVPIMGKLSDLYGRRLFYIGGLAVFMLGSIVSGFSVSFEMLVAGRAIQGLGMGTIMPLSQTIIGDIIPPRQRGKYQGFMGAIFGVTSVAGPLAGGLITDNLGWRWNFFSTIPLGIVALFFVVRFLKLPHVQRKAKVDVWGILTLAPSLVMILLATSWGGTTYAWNSAVIISLFVLGGLGVVAFVFVEMKAEEPLLPLRLFRNSVFTAANIAAFSVSMVMFGATIYIPVYAQGVLGVSATDSGLILLPLMIGFILVGIGAGLLITRTGRYKEIMLLGVLTMFAGVWLMSRLDAESTQTQLSIAMVVLGIGLGASMQQYTLVVQNAVARRDLGIATASTQFFRNVGATVGIAVFGSLMTGGLAKAITSHLPPGVAEQMGDRVNNVGVGDVLDPSATAGLPPAVADAIRHGLADRLHIVFLAILPILVISFFATLAIKAMPLRDTISTPDEARREFLDTMSQSSGRSEVVPSLNHYDDEGARTRERVLALQMHLMVRESKRPERELLRRAITEIGEGKLENGQAVLERTATMLSSEDPADVAEAEKYAATLAKLASRKGGILSNGIRQDIAVRVAEGRDRTDVLSGYEDAVTDNYEAVDVTQLRAAANDLSTVLLLDLDVHAGRRPEPATR